ncbi:MAG: DUF6431 domain-containing protein [Lachnospiraceae bacterium]|nr:DUF6431 domain-containing protein [Lachnospiraceae bacterium]
MVFCGEDICPKCGGELRYFDTVRRSLRTKRGEQSWVKIRRLRCKSCGSVHRELPEIIFPYKQYETEIIQGVIEGLITSDTLGYEDYPCEMTMIRWRSQNLHLL